jgi:hypothetical protein
MSFGIEIKNNDGNTILGEGQPTFLIRGAGTANFGADAGTGYAPGGGPGDGSDGYIPLSGISYNGKVLGSDFLFGAPYSSSGFSSTAQVHMEGTITSGILGRVQRRWGRNEASQGASISPKPPQFKWFQVAGANQNGFPVPSSSTTDYGLEVYASNGDVNFTTTDLSSFGTIQAVVQTSSNSSSFSIGGETYLAAHTATFIAPAGENIYDYYTMFNQAIYQVSGQNQAYATKFVYQQSTRSITIISSSIRRKFIIAKLNT